MLLKVCMGSVFESATLDEVYLSAVFLGRFSSMLLDGSFYHSNTRFFSFCYRIRILCDFSATKNTGLSGLYE
jgi:hypothetical protein